MFCKFESADKSGTFGGSVPPVAWVSEPGADMPGVSGLGATVAKLPLSNATLEELVARSKISPNGSVGHNPA